MVDRVLVVCGGGLVCAGGVQVCWRYDAGDGGELGEMDARLLHTTRLACVRVTRLRAPQRIQGTRGLRS